MLGKKILLILVPILLVEAQNSYGTSNGFSRAIPSRRPIIRPRPAPVVTSVPNVPIITEKNEIVTVPQPPVIYPKEEDYVVPDPHLIVPPHPTKLTIIYPENYKPTTSSPPEPSKLRIPIRLPTFQPRPVESNYIAPTTMPPPPPTSTHFNFMPRFPAYATSQPVAISETAKPIDIITEEAAPTESNFPQSFVSNEPENRPIPALLEPIVKPTERIPEPLESEPIEPALKPIEPVPEPSVSVPEPTESVPEPIESVPEPSEHVSLETFEPPAPSVSMPINWHHLASEEPASPETTQQPAITLPPPTTTVQPIEYRRPAIIPTKRPTIINTIYVASSEFPKENLPVEESIKPFMDIVNPSISESETINIEENKPLDNKPMINWYPAQQRPKPTLAVPSATEVYTYIPTVATKKPIARPISPAKPWSQPSVDIYSYVNRLHNYSCRSSDGYESVLNQCDAYIECKHNMALHYICPDGLHFNPAAKWPEYPCGYPSEVKCESHAVIQEPRPTGQCPHRYGFYPIPGGDCGQYIMCQEGLATIMSCPPGLAFSSITNSCDWPANVPGCNPNIFQGFTCPASSLDKYGKQTNNNSKYRYKNSCNQYIACYKGNPRLLSCDAGMSFDARSGTCVDADQVVDCQY